MVKSHAPWLVFPNRSIALLGIWLAILGVAGGASRAGEVGQLLCRTVGWAILLGIAILARRLPWRAARPVNGFLAAMILLAVLQLVPLPPALWTALPGREVFARAVSALGEAQPWRPLSVSPDATMNSLSSLIVPVATLTLMIASSLADRWRIASLLLLLILASAVLALLQLSGARIENPFINNVPGMVSGSFANRNHFALFAAMGCLIAPAWALRGEQMARWKPPVAVFIVLLLGLIILAAGSRTGLLLGALGIAIGLAIVRREALRAISGRRRAVVFAAVGAIVVLGATAVILSIASDRAVSIDRLLHIDESGEIRSRARPIVAKLVGSYFPIGAGVGTFDPVFRMAEPFVLLKRSYFNHAHNDFLEVALEGGAPALILLGAVLVWWLRASIAAWRFPVPAEGPFARIGSGIVFLVLVASLSDYPARTPMIMAVLVIAGVWIADRRVDGGQVSNSARSRRTRTPLGGRASP